MLATKKVCCGCKACMNICPKNAIYFKEDLEGFSYPEVREEMCIHCSLCTEVCPIYEKSTGKNTEDTVYIGMQHKNRDILEGSSSGGAFFTIAQYVISQGGVVYGAAFDKSFSVVHKAARSEKALRMLCGSKYVQSDMGECYHEIENDIESGHTVLFTGTPCQNEALRRYLYKRKRDSSKLLLCDLICHGVPSPGFWQSYIRNMESKYGKVTDVKFRDKEYGWDTPNMAMEMGGYSWIKIWDDEPYYNMFFSNLIVRPSCFQCRFASDRRVGDFTMGDFWGGNKIMGKMVDPNRGISLLFLNSIKSKEVWGKIKGNIIYTILERRMFYQKNLLMPTSEPRTRGEFWDDYQKEGLDFVIKKYRPKNGMPLPVKRKIVKVIKKMGLYNQCVVLASKIKK